MRFNLIIVFLVNRVFEASYVRKRRDHESDHTYLFLNAVANRLASEIVDLVFLFPSVHPRSPTVSKSQEVQSHDALECEQTSAMGGMLALHETLSDREQLYQNHAMAKTSAVESGLHHFSKVSPKVDRPASSMADGIAFDQTIPNA